MFCYILFSAFLHPPNALYSSTILLIYIKAFAKRLLLILYSLVFLIYVCCFYIFFFHPCDTNIERKKNDTNSRKLLFGVLYLVIPRTYCKVKIFSEDLMKCQYILDSPFLLFLFRYLDFASDILH